ncbi:MAG: hypothetical protein SPK50_02930 [Mobiluncus porci]|uniref:Uncharacterized protein n=1 Tax=Mobiluncus porci TaxID=2652278 RepID=A0A7K0K0A7_9ACTO|nr:hypothetical protein [Mobiluncus porci]MDD7541182.1 hypothetical protein [Mobiluncus porci]MDY5748071.1 hypothetical protein [Mobiluncus porci]MST48926.1 hypothetical protein [Mobiluncus porci]
METIEWAKSYLGEVDEQDLNARVERLGSIRLAVIETLKERRATMLGSALSVTIPGAVSVSFKDNISALDRLIAGLEKDTDGDGITDFHPVEITALKSRWAR